MPCNPLRSVWNRVERPCAYRSMHCLQQNDINRHMIMHMLGPRSYQEQPLQVKHLFASSSPQPLAESHPCLLHPELVMHPVHLLLPLGRLSSAPQLQQLPETQSVSVAWVRAETVSAEMMQQRWPLHAELPRAASGCRRIPLNHEGLRVLAA